MKTTHEKISALIKAAKTTEAVRYILMPVQEKIGEYGETISTQDFDKYDNAEFGYIDEDGEFVCCDYKDSWATKISWWDGSNTVTRYANDDECEIKDLKFLGSEKVSEKGCYQVWEGFYLDVDNDTVYIEYSDNNQQNITQHLIEVELEGLEK